MLELHSSCQSSDISSALNIVQIFRIFSTFSLSAACVCLPQFSTSSRACMHSQIQFVAYGITHRALAAFPLYQALVSSHIILPFQRMRWHCITGKIPCYFNR